MKILTIVLCLFSSVVFASESLPNRPDNNKDKESSLESVADIQVFETKPNKPFTLISPLSADKKTVDKAFIALKAKAKKMGANAIMEYGCVAGTEVKSGLLGIRTANTDSVCTAKAIRIQ